MFRTFTYGNRGVSKDFFGAPEQSIPVGPLMGPLFYYIPAYKIPKLDFFWVMFLIFIYWKQVLKHVHFYNSYHNAALWTVNYRLKTQRHDVGYWIYHLNFLWDEGF